MALVCAGLLLAPAVAARAGAQQPPVGASAAAADSDSPPPWSAEAPGAAGAPLGLGLDAPFERQGSLTIDSARTTVTTQDLARGTTTIQVLDTDPGLLNRKFAIRWKTASFGAQLPFALPRFSFGEGLSITPTLVLQAAGSDVGLDFIDLPQPRASTSLHGRGLQLGAALDLVGPLCRHCGWYAGAGYRYRFFPSFTVERGQPVEEPGAQVTASEVRLGRSVGEASFRLGRVFDRDRTALYVGVLRRQVRTTVDDHLTLVDDLIAQQTRLASRTGFASTATAALAGVDVHVRGPLYVRAEVTFGKFDSAVLGKLVLVPPLKPWFPEVHVRRKQTSQTEVRAAQIAGEIAPGLVAIRKRFVKESRRLLAQQPAPSALEVSRLLDDTTCALLTTLSFPELTALRDYVKDLFAKAREGLGLGPTTATCALTGDSQFKSLEPQTAAPPAPPARAPRALRAVLSSRWRASDVRAAAQRTDVDRRAAKGWFDKLADILATMSRQAADDDIRVSLCIRSEPQGAEFSLHYMSDPDPKHNVLGTPINTNRQLRIYRGIYHYAVELQNYEPVNKDTKDTSIDVVMNAYSILNCVLLPKGSAKVRVCDWAATGTECTK